MAGHLHLRNSVFERYVYRRQVTAVSSVKVTIVPSGTALPLQSRTGSVTN